MTRGCAAHRTAWHQHCVVHVSAHGETIAKLKVSGFSSSKQVELHDLDQPSAEPCPGEETLCAPAGGLFARVAASFEDRAIDVVHIVTTGDLSASRSMLGFRGLTLHSSKDDKDEALSFVGCRDIGAFLSRAGAWAFVLSGPPDKEAALRHFADGVAQARPGPVIYHQFNLASVNGEFWPSIKMLLRLEWVPPPRFGTGFMYCQPSLIMPGVERLSKTVLDPYAVSDDQSDSADAIEALRNAFAELGTSKQVARWIAASQRFVEGVELEALRGRAGDSLLRNLLGEPQVEGKVVSTDATSKVVAKTITDMQRIIGSFVRKIER